MSGEIVERLRCGIVWDEVTGEVREMMTEDLMVEAASHIDALEAENERFRQALVFLAKHIPDDVPWFELHERAEWALSQAKE